MTDDSNSILELKNWLCYIADIAYDRDGFHNAKDLGDLIDELRSFALDALKGEICPVNSYNAERKED